MTRGLVLSILTSLLTACGGTGTLYVTARFSSDGSTPSSRARVTVREAASTGGLVTDAQVSVTGSKMPKTGLPFAMMSNDYRADGFGWDESLRLEVVRGTDRVEATVQSPGFTVITAPTQDGTVVKANGLLVTWRDAGNAPANIVRLRLEQADVDVTLADDKFQYRIGADPLVVTDRESVYLERSNEIAPEGGAPGSVISATTTHAIQFKVE
ncbi:MAG: hypothetical protein Q8L48_39510 [Archangium sp.]|nr:hypothetical protein [Archangium sp.]